MPSQTISVATSADDAEEKADGSGFTSTATTWQPVEATADEAARNWFAAVFELSADIPDGSTISQATLRTYPTGKAIATNIHRTVHIEDTVAADDFSTTADIVSRTYRTPNDSGFTTVADPTEFSFTSAMQDLIDDEAGLSSGDIICIAVECADDAQNETHNAMGTEDHATETPPALYIEWTEPSSWVPKVIIL